MKRLVRKANDDILIRDLRKLQETVGTVTIQLYSNFEKLNDLSSIEILWGTIKYTWNIILEEIDEKYYDTNRNVINAAGDVIDAIASIEDSDIQRHRRLKNTEIVAKMTIEVLTDIVQKIEKLIETLQTVSV